MCCIGMCMCCKCVASNQLSAQTGTARTSHALRVLAFIAVVAQDQHAIMVTKPACFNHTAGGVWRGGCVLVVWLWWLVLIVFKMKEGRRIGNELVETLSTLSSNTFTLMIMF